MPEPTSENPFQSPATHDEDQLYVTSGVVQSLRRTRPWVLFLAILGVIFIAFMLFGMVGMMFTAAMTGGATGLPSGFFAGMVLFYGVMIVTYLFPLVFMFKYASRINRLTATGEANWLQAALEAQKSLWKSIGIAMIAFMAAYAVFMALIVAGGVAATAPNFQNQGGVGVPAPPAPVSVEEDAFDELFGPIEGAD